MIKKKRKKNVKKNNTPNTPFIKSPFKKKKQNKSKNIIFGSEVAAKLN